jgi:hypothetical protein
MGCDVLWSCRWLPCGALTPRGTKCMSCTSGHCCVMWCGLDWTGSDWPPFLLRPSCVFSGVTVTLNRMAPFRQLPAMLPRLISRPFCSIFRRLGVQIIWRAHCSLERRNSVSDRPWSGRHKSRRWQYSIILRRVNRAIAVMMEAEAALKLRSVSTRQHGATS